MATDQTLTQLEAYYELNLRQLRWSFFSSLATLFVGLVALVIGIFLALFGQSSILGQLALISGAMTEFVGAGFFVMYGRNLAQLNIFYDKLIKHKDTLYAISLANHMTDPADKSKALFAVIGSLLSRGEPPTPPEVLAALASKQ